METIVPAGCYRRPALSPLAGDVIGLETLASTYPRVCGLGWSPLAGDVIGLETVPPSLYRRLDVEPVSTRWRCYWIGNIITAIKAVIFSSSPLAGDVIGLETDFPIALDSAIQGSLHSLEMLLDWKQRPIGEESIHHITVSTRWRCYWIGNLVGTPLDFAHCP